MKPRFKLRVLPDGRAAVSFWWSGKKYGLMTQDPVTSVDDAVRQCDLLCRSAVTTWLLLWEQEREREREGARASAPHLPPPPPRSPGDAAVIPGHGADGGDDAE